MKRLLSSLMVALCLAATTSAQTRDLPAGWFRAGSRPADYEMGLDPTGGRSGGAAFIKGRAATFSPESFATVMQQIAVGDYRGKRLRLSAFVKAAGVDNWSGLWMRIDGETPMTTLGFDNMQNRPINGTREWQRYEIVLDVPAASGQIAFGLLLAGAGQVWFDDLRFDVVGTDVPTTNVMPSTPTSRPANLDFN